MQGYEPFSYINEQNASRLADIFIVRKAEPWLIAVIASYLRPGFARQMIASMPVEMQAKVAVEALTLRQVTREQVITIDAHVKKSLDLEGQ